MEVLYFKYHYVAGDQNMCTEDQFRCILTAECIPISWLCDEETDCSDASDEEYCIGKICNRLRQRFYHIKNALLI